MVYAQLGTLITDRREVAESTTWDTQTEWEANQAASLVTLDSGTVTIQDIPARGIIGHWPGDEGSGTTLADTVGSNDITLNGPTWQSNSALEGGVGIYFEQGDTASGQLQQPSAWTWMIRVAADNLGSSSPTYRTVIAHDIAPFIAYDVGTEQWRFQDVNDTQANVADPQSSVESDTRILVLRLDPAEDATFEVYDGSQSLVGSDTINSPANGYDTSTTDLGSYGDGSREWRGVIDPNLYQVDNRISDTEVTDLLGEF